MKTKIHNFNLVEIIIAMGIVVICITTIVGLFSAGMKLSKNATMQTYSNFMFEQMAGLAERYPNVKTNIPNSKQYASSTDTDWTSGINIKAKEDACTTAIDVDDPFFKNVYIKSGEYGLYKINFQTTVNSSNVVDFTAVVRMWYDTVAATPITVSKGSDITLDKRLKIEITWPEKMPYYDRILSGHVIEKEWVMEP